MMGSTVRERGPIDDFKSGVVEGGKGLMYGWWDGITGLVTEPIEGGKKEVRSLTLRPLMGRVLWAY